MIPKKYLQFVRDIAQLYGVRLRLRPNTMESYYTSGRGLITIGYAEISINEFLYTFFHELGHHLNYLEGKYALYHSPRNHAEFTDAELRTVIRTALRAEQYTDQRAAELIDMWYPGLEYTPTYSQPIEKEIYEYAVLTWFRWELAYRKLAQREKR